MSGALAIIGAGPVGLSLALHASRSLPHFDITLFDARSADKDVSQDPRTLAISLGSVQLLQRLKAWPEHAAQPIVHVHVSQVPPTWPAGPMRDSTSGSIQPKVDLSAAELGVPQLGAVLAYGPLVTALQQAWDQAVAREPSRLHTRFGVPVRGLKPLRSDSSKAGSGVEVDAEIAEAYDLAVVAAYEPVWQDARTAPGAEDLLKNARVVPALPEVIEVGVGHRQKV